MVIYIFLITYDNVIILVTKIKNNSLKFIFYLQATFKCPKLQKNHALILIPTNEQVWKII